MALKLPRFQHTRRDNKTGQYRKTPACDGCGKPVGTNYYTDEEVCNGSDGPGFYLCERKRCIKTRDLSVDARRILYTSQRKLNSLTTRIRTATMAPQMSNLEFMLKRIHEGEYTNRDSGAFQADLLITYEVIDHPKAAKAFALAWQYGHSAGLTEVVNYFNDLVELLK